LAMRELSGTIAARALGKAKPKDKDAQANARKARLGFMGDRRTGAASIGC